MDSTARADASDRFGTMRRLEYFLADIHVYGVILSQLSWALCVVVAEVGIVRSRQIFYGAFGEGASGRCMRAGTRGCVCADYSTSL